MEENISNGYKWRYPHEVMKLHQMKKKKRALQARITQSTQSNSFNVSAENSLQITTGLKRKNPFLSKDVNGIKRPENIETESTDNTLFKLLHCTKSNIKCSESAITSFNNVLKQNVGASECTRINTGESWIPIDWTLKSKMRIMSPKPLPWSSLLKISEEASGVTSFVRCLNSEAMTSLNDSLNTKFHQSCLYWQHPNLPWLKLFPRSTRKASASGPSIGANSEIGDSLYQNWMVALKSLFQLLKTRQCPYFYVCANTFTALFRAAGICGFNEMHVMITPSTKGFRDMLRKADIEFTLPLKVETRDQDCTSLSSLGDSQVNVDCNVDAIDEDDVPDNWLESLGIGVDEIKKINYVQERKIRSLESENDNNEKSLLMIEGQDVQEFYNFLLNCRSIVQLIGPLAGIPPTILAPVAFNKATLDSLQVRQSKVNLDNESYYSLEVTGPILPHLIHNIFSLSSVEHDISATFANINSTMAFSKIRYDPKVKVHTDESENVFTRSNSAVFKRENLSDCGFNADILETFCTEDPKRVLNVDCLKFTATTKLFSWT